ncbi:MAG: efflux RND transporter periplasmic adaptor subunit [Verrucomicrobiota bacterium]
MRAHPARLHRALWRPSFAVTRTLGLGLGLLVAVTGCQRSKEVQVQAEKVQRRNLTETVMATGKVQPVTLVKITPEVAGEIIELPVKEGQKVRKGDLLVRIRRDLYEAGLRSSQASLRSAEAALVTAQANERKAAAEFQRTEELFQKKLVSESVHDDLRTALEVSRANVASATQQIEIAKASIKRAEEDLLKTTILAPIDDTVTRLASEVGERVHGTGMMAGTEILNLADLGEMEARVEVGEVTSSSSNPANAPAWRSIPSATAASAASSPRSPAPPRPRAWEPSRNPPSSRCASASRTRNPSCPG